MSQHGHIYHFKIASLIAWQGYIKEKKNFHLELEKTDVGAFDDIVLRLRNENGDKDIVYFIQVKHSEEKEKPKKLKVVSYDKLESKSGPFSLKKYFDSNQKIYENIVFKNCVCKFILCTNLQVATKESWASKNIVMEDAEAIDYFEKISLNFIKLKMEQNCELRKILTSNLSSSLPLYEKMNMDIDNFMENLVILTTREEDDLDKILKDELENQHKLLNAKSFCNDLYQEVLNQTKTKSKSGINYNKIHEIQLHIQKTIKHLTMTGANSEFCKKLRSYVCEDTFKTINENAANFINCTSKRVLHLACKTPNLLNSIRIEQTLRSLYEKLGRFIFNPLSNLLKMEENLTEEYDILIIFDDELLTNYAHLEKFCKRMFENEKTKIIFISEEESDLTKIIYAYLKTHNVECSFEKHVDVFQFCDLSEEAQNILFKKKVSFQGEEIQIGKLLNGHFDLLDAKTLHKLMILKETFVISKKEKQIPYYIERKFRCVKVKANIFKELNENEGILLLIEGDIKIFEKFMKRQYIDQTRILLSTERLANLKRSVFIILHHDVESQYKRLYALNTNYSIHWLKFKENQLFWYRSHGSLNIIRQNIQNNSRYFEEKQFLNFISNSQFIIITDSPGSGKTTSIVSLAEQFKCNKILWKIIITLNNYTDTLMKIKWNTKHDFKFLYENDGEEDYAKVILHLLSNKPTIVNKTFENCLFERFFKEGKILIVFDGYDEICPDYEPLIKDLLTKIKKETNNMVWVTSRMQFKDTLENHLNTFAYTMEPFSERERLKLITSFWEHEYLHSEYTNWKLKYPLNCKDRECSENRKICYMHRQKIKKYAKEVFRKNLNHLPSFEICSNSLFGNPLQIRMFAEIFQLNDGSFPDDDKGNNWQHCFAYMASNETTVLVNEITDIFHLYEIFVKKKINDSFLNNKNIMDLSKPPAKNFQSRLYRYEIKVHKILAVLTLLGEEKCKEILTDKEIQKAKIWIVDFRKGMENLGLISHLTANNYVRFVHSTYAEYLAARFLGGRLAFQPDGIIKSIETILQKDVPFFAYFIKCSFDNDIDRKTWELILKEELFVEYTIKRDYICLLKAILRPSDIIKLNKKGKTLLHHAAEFGNVKAIIAILIRVYSILIKDQKVEQIYPNNSRTNDHPLLRCEHSAVFLSQYANIKDISGKSALDYAKERQQKDCTILLKEINRIGQVLQRKNGYKNADIINNIKRRVKNQKVFTPFTSKRFPLAVDFEFFGSFTEQSDIYKHYYSNAMFYPKFFEKYDLPDCRDISFTYM